MTRNHVSKMALVPHSGFFEFLAINREIGMHPREFHTATSMRLPFAMLGIPFCRLRNRCPAKRRKSPASRGLKGLPFFWGNFQVQFMNFRQSKQVFAMRFVFASFVYVAWLFGETAPDAD